MKNDTNPENTACVVQLFHVCQTLSSWFCSFGSFVDYTLFDFESRTLF